jgi:hypothetical protein
LVTAVEVDDPFSESVAVDDVTVDSHWLRKLVAVLKAGADKSERVGKRGAGLGFVNPSLDVCQSQVVLVGALGDFRCISCCKAKVFQ